MALKKSNQKSDPDLFATASFSLPERERRYMEDELSWHNEFYRNVLLNIDEEDRPSLITDVQVKPANAADNGWKPSRGRSGRSATTSRRPSSSTAS